jgi:hypothetical protein
MKKTVSSKPKSKKHFSTPEWMSDDVAEKAQEMNVFARIEMAQKLEKAAAQLREFKPIPIPAVANANVLLKPNVKKAILYYAEMSGAKKEWTEQEKLDVGARWFLEEALPMFQSVVYSGNDRCRYRDAEGLEDSRQVEDMIGRALEAFKAEKEQANESDD